MTLPESTNAAAANRNRQAWNLLARQQKRFTRAASDDEFSSPLRVLDSDGWLGDAVRGRRVLCLGAGGGRHGPLYAAAGAVVTVVDVSPAQLQLDRQVAQERQLTLRTIETSMDDLTMLRTADFDLVVQPVSSCYLPDLRPVYQQIARVLAIGGLYISQHKQPTSLQVSAEPKSGEFPLAEPYYREGPLPPVMGSLHREEGTFEYLHRWEQLLGQMCRAGFVIEDVTEPFHADATADPCSFAYRSCFVAPYVRVKARRSSSEPASVLESRVVWGG